MKNLQLKTEALQLYRLLTPREQATYRDFLRFLAAGQLQAPAVQE